MSWTTFLVPFIAGVFALAGAWFGSRSSRINEHEKWLRQARTEAFVRFLRILNECEDRIYAREGCPHGDNDQVGMWLHDQLLPAFNEARVVRLFLEPSQRDALREDLLKLVDAFWPPPSGVLKGGVSRQLVLNDIQKVLEEHLMGLGKGRRSG